MRTFLRYTALSVTAAILSACQVSAITALDVSGQGRVDVSWSVIFQAEAADPLLTNPADTELLGARIATELGVPVQVKSDRRARSVTYTAHVAGSRVSELGDMLGIQAVRSTLDQGADTIEVAIETMVPARLAAAVTEAASSVQDGGTLALVAAANTVIGINIEFRRDITHASSQWSVDGRTATAEWALSDEPPGVLVVAAPTGAGPALWGTVIAVLGLLAVGWFAIKWKW